MVQAAHTDPVEIGMLWNEAYWNEFEYRVRKRALEAKNDKDAWKIIVRASRKVMSRYTTSFFIVSRFLPRIKRRMVEVVYAAVRYPDEVVDTFPLTIEERHERLDHWEQSYEHALTCNSLCDALEADVPAFVAAFARVVREQQIPPEHYRSFISAMRHDITPRPFVNLEDLIDNYVYGSAVVVGYFLAYVYGPSAPEKMNDVLACSRNLGIGLQLTNFLRDVKEDQQRKRLYLPLDMLRLAGVHAGESVDLGDLDEPANRRKVLKVIHQMAEVAENYYQKSDQQLGAFAPDCRIAIKACIDVYGKLNAQIAASSDCIERRESVSMREKFSALPAGKFWRVPLSLLGW